MLTVDLEDWFHILGRHGQPAGVWDHLPSHVEADTQRLLDLFDRYGARATFFVLGWSGDRCPGILREIVRRGHCLGSHGYHHRRPDTMSESEFVADLLRSVKIIEDAAGVKVWGYRAPGFGVRDCTFPYLDVLDSHGFLYDSSVFPGLFPGRGQQGAPTHPYCPVPARPAFWEVPVSAVHVLGVPIVFAGGGSLRLLPFWFVRWAARSCAAAGLPAVYYLHPRDVCPEGPTIRTSPWRRWRYYGGRDSLRRKLESILSSGPVTSVEEFLATTKGGNLT